MSSLIDYPRMPDREWPAVVICLFLSRTCRVTRKLISLVGSMDAWCLKYLNEDDVGFCVRTLRDAASYFVGPSIHYGQCSLRWCPDVFPRDLAEASKWHQQNFAFLLLIYNAH